MAGSAMPTTVASMEAIADPRTVASNTQRPRAARVAEPGLRIGCHPQVGPLGSPHPSQ
jgi:hypothetical protein